MSEIDNDKIMEVSVVISEAESSLTNRICHESHSQCRSIHGNLGDLHDDGCLSRFKMPVGSTNPLRKDFLDETSIGTGTTEASTNVSDTEDSLEEENSMLNKLFEDLDAVIGEPIGSATHVRDHKSVSADMLSNI